MSHPHPELTAPGPLAKGGMRVIPLGGLGEIGRNMTVFETTADCSSSTAACSSPRSTTPAST